MISCRFGRCRVWSTVSQVYRRFLTALVSGGTGAGYYVRSIMLKFFFLIFSCLLTSNLYFLSLKNGGESFECSHRAKHTRSAGKNYARGAAVNCMLFVDSMLCQILCSSCQLVPANSCPYIVISIFCRPPQQSLVIAGKVCTICSWVFRQRTVNTEPNTTTTLLPFVRELAQMPAHMAHRVK